MGNKVKENTPQQKIYNKELIKYKRKGFTQGNSLQCLNLLFNSIKKLKLLY
jgi:hypothetical protein